MMKVQYFYVTLLQMDISKFVLLLFSLLFYIIFSFLRRIDLLFFKNCEFRYLLFSTQFRSVKTIERYSSKRVYVYKTNTMNKIVGLCTAPLGKLKLKAKIEFYRCSRHDQI